MPHGYEERFMNGLRIAFSVSLLIFLAGGPLQAEPQWVTNQAARLAIGQPFFTRQSPLSSRATIGGAGGVAYGADTLVVADGNRVGSQPLNNRVLVYRNVGSFLPKPGDELSQDGECPACLGLPDVVLGQPDFDTFIPNVENGMQNPTGVATDGVRIAVADTDNNRVLIWHSIPTQDGHPPDVVIGQGDAVNNAPGTSSTLMRGPQGVWFDQSGKFFVADTQNSRVLIYNSVPTTTGAAADVVLGQPDFDTRPEPDLTQSNVDAAATTMLDPVAVTTKNNKLFVTDLGFNRILIFNGIPVSNNAPADVVVGQPNMESKVANNVSELCQPLENPPGESPNEDDPNADLLNTNASFPLRCDRTLSFPRFAISDGEKLYVSDGGNDRILIFNEIPTGNAPYPNTVIGQQDFFTLFESDGAASVRAPQAIAHDGENLYVTDPFARRILVFTPGENQIVQNGLRNAASFLIRATGTLVFDRGDRFATDYSELGDEFAKAGQQFDVEIGGSFLADSQPDKYTYTAVGGETAEAVRDAFAEQINNDPNAVAFAESFIGEGDHAKARIQFGGSVREGEVVTLMVGGRSYAAQMQAGDPAFVVVDRIKFFAKVDPLVAVMRDPKDVATLMIVAREVGPIGNGIPYAVHVEQGSAITVAAEGDVLSGGGQEHILVLSAKEEGPIGNDLQLKWSKNIAGGLDIDTTGARFIGGSDARELPAGTLATIFGTGFADSIYSATLENGRLPTELGGVSLYANGILAPLLMVSPTQVNFQIPWETAGTTVSVYVRRRLPDGSIQVSVPRATNVTRAAPGLFAFSGEEPRRAVALHGQDKATGTVAIQAIVPVGPGEVQPGLPTPAGVIVTIFVNGRSYTIETTEAESPFSIRDRLVDLINAGEGDPDVVAKADQIGFFSARATVTFKGEIRANDTFTAFVNDRLYTVIATEDDTLLSIRNKLAQKINSGFGDIDVTAELISSVGDPRFQIVARKLGEEGNNIFFNIAISPDESPTTLETDLGEDVNTLKNGRTPPVVFLTAREAGQVGNEITFGGESSDIVGVRVTAAATNLCCGNEKFSLITQENPASPGETIILYATGLGFTSPLPQGQGLESGMPTPIGQLFNVPFNSEDFVSALAGRKTAQVRWVGLAPLLIGTYQINLKLLEDLPDNPALKLTIAQKRFVSNPVTIPVKNITPRLNRTDANPHR
ncbi:MAG: hypothetical protein CMN58_07710 [Solibacterales bacterium]|nr:hypothetical protein [Bryobacterales bacterium]